jgi:3-oxoacyl-(acyl-carrier-protein) synthase
LEWSHQRQEWRAPHRGIRSLYLPVQIAAEIPSFDWQSQLNPKDRKHVPRTVPLALAAAREALEDARLFPEDLSLEERRAFGVELGTGGGGPRIHGTAV